MPANANNPPAMLPKLLVFDASVVFNFGHHGQLEELLAQFKTAHDLYVTPTVKEEVSKEASFDYETFCAQHFTVQPTTVPEALAEALPALSQRLDAGEIEVLLLAGELGAAAMGVIDERAARQVARVLGIAVTGTLGLLHHAVQREWLTDEAALQVVARLRARRFRCPPVGGVGTLTAYLARLDGA